MDRTSTGEDRGLQVRVGVGEDKRWDENVRQEALKSDLVIGGSAYDKEGTG